MIGVFFSGLFHGNLLLHVILVGMNGNIWEYKTTSSGPWTINGVVEYLRLGVFLV